MNVPPTLKWSWLCKAGQEVSDNGSSPHRGQTAGAHACPAFSRTRSSCRSSSIPLPPPTMCRAQGWMKHKHWVGAHLLHQLFEDRSFTGTWFYSLKISISRGDTSHMSFGGTLHHENKPAEHSPISAYNLESAALSLSHWQIEHLCN